MNQPGNEPVHTGFGRHGDTDVIEYPGVSVKGVTGIVLGVASALALVNPLFWVIPLVGVVVCAVALREIRISPQPLGGRTAALVGLGLALVFGTAGLSRQASHSWWVRHEAREFCRLWLQLLADDEPHKAHQLTLSPTDRQPIDAHLWDYYRTEPKALTGLKTFVEHALVRALLALDGRAQFRYWGTDRRDRLTGPLYAPTLEQIDQLFAVTYAGDGHKTTFFVRLAVARFVDSETGVVRWQVIGYRGGVRPGEDPHRRF